MFQRHAATRVPRFSLQPQSTAVDCLSANSSRTELQKVAHTGQIRLCSLSKHHEQATVSTLSNDEVASTATCVDKPIIHTADVWSTNIHTSNLEFYGAASSVSFIHQMAALSNCKNIGLPNRSTECSLTPLLQNAEFPPDLPRSMRPEPQQLDIIPDRWYFRVARQFLDAYFSNIHYIQPLFEKDDFLARCEDLWFGKPDKQPLSFVALYFATLSLGSLVMTFEATTISGSDRFIWSRKLFKEALTILTSLGTAVSVELTQCYYMMVS